MSSTNDPNPTPADQPDPTKAGAKPDPAKLTWTPPAPGSPGLQEQGPWAMLRLIGRARVAPAGTDRVLLTFKDGERTATVELRAALNPFTSTALQEFRCPNVQ